VCVRACVYVVHISRNTSHAYTYTRTRTNAHMYTRAHTHTHPHTRPHARTHARTRDGRVPDGVAHRNIGPFFIDPRWNHGDKRVVEDLCGMSPKT